MAIYTLRDLYLHSVNAYSSRCMSSMYGGECVTFAEFARKVEAEAEMLRMAGLSSGDKVALLSNNMPNWAVSYFAAVISGLVIVPILPDFSTPELDMIIRHCGAKALCCSDKLYTKVSKETIEGLNVVLRTKNCGVIYMKEGVQPGVFTEPKADDVAAIIYTSGTTSKPKGVMLTHENILENAKGVMGNIRPAPEDTWFSFLPLSHTFERTTTYYLAMGMGNQIFFNRNILQIVDDLKYVRPSILMSVPRIYETVYSKLNSQLAKKGAVARYVFNWAVEVGWRRFCKANGLPVENSWRECIDGLMADWLD